MCQLRWFHTSSLPSLSARVCLAPHPGEPGVGGEVSIQEEMHIDFHSQQRQPAGSKLDHPP